MDPFQLYNSILVYDPVAILKFDTFLEILVSIVCISSGSAAAKIIASTSFSIWDNFEGKLNFTITLVPNVTDTSWVESNIKEMKKTLELDSVPKINKSSEQCMYLDAGKEFI